MRSSIVLIIISSLLFTSCGKASDPASPVSGEKTPFMVETFVVGGIQSLVSVEKA